MEVNKRQSVRLWIPAFAGMTNRSWMQMTTNPPMHFTIFTLLWIKLALTLNLRKIGDLVDRVAEAREQGEPGRALYGFCTSNWTPACAGVTR